MRTFRVMWLRREGRATRLLMIQTPRTKSNPHRQNPGCVWLQSWGFLAQFWWDLPSYVLDLVDVSMRPVQFETRHPPQYNYLDPLPAE